MVTCPALSLFIKKDKNNMHWFFCRGGLILMILGEVGNFSAYGFAPASLVAPLGTTTVIGNESLIFAISDFKQYL